MTTLSTDQQAALDAAMTFLTSDTQNELVISGHGGTGKTFLTSMIISEAHKRKGLLGLLLNKVFEPNIVLTSTTNKAAKVLHDATGVETSTIHSYLNLRVFNNYDTGAVVLKQTKQTDVKENTIIIIDEASMINKDLLKLIRSLTLNCKVLYIGDSFQLAPVKENASPVFTDPNIPQVCLTTIHRQAAGSPIITFAEKFRNALTTDVFPSTGPTGPEIMLIDHSHFEAEIIKAYSSAHGPDDLKVLAWTNARVHEYNSFLRSLIVHTDEYQVGEYLLTNQPILYDGGVAHSTDAIVQIKDIWHETQENINGWTIQLMSGYTIFQPFSRSEVNTAMKAAAKEKDWSNYFMYKEEFADLRPVHASTINKSQGSTYHTVFIDLDDIAKCTKNSDIARMMYVAITRASHKVIMCGQLPNRLTYAPT